MRASRFLRPMQRLDGRRFHGMLLDEKSDSGVEPSNRILRTSSVLDPRELFRDPTGRVYLVGTHGVPGSYRVYEMDRELQWIRTVEAKDPVTGLPRGDTAEDQGNVWVSLTPAGALTGALPAEVPEYRMLTGAALAAGDRVGTYTVARADTLAGITVAEVR